MGRILSAGLTLVFTLMGFLLLASVLYKLLPLLLEAYSVVRSVYEIGAGCGATGCAGLPGETDITVLDAYVARTPEGDLLVIHACGDKPATARIYVNGVYAGSVMLPFDPLPDHAVCRRVAIVIVAVGDGYRVMVYNVGLGEARGLEGLARMLGGRLHALGAPLRVTLEAGSKRLDIIVERVVASG